METEAAVLLRFSAFRLPTLLFDRLVALFAVLLPPCEDVLPGSSPGVYLLGRKHSSKGRLIRLSDRLFNRPFLFPLHPPHSLLHHHSHHVPSLRFRTSGIPDNITLFGFEYNLPSRPPNLQPSLSIAHYLIHLV